MNKSTTSTLTWSEFSKVEMRIGTIISAEAFREAKNPSFKMIIDFGPLGKRKTSAQITKLYTSNELIGKQVVAVVNFPAKQIANIMSECLVLGGLGQNDKIVLLQPEQHIANGSRVS